ncbi:AAA family ATPase [Acidianus sulfidivorans JP7]|uniref:AAA family ATPase n=1 Tax=Acidianus sulfidivorans JP7 TaxID=619593 RepID=A0A2U9IQD0_9CREN|nr:AAA family ATPase [Acidianus sulfidivorans]AWR98186.1 AAA family ATPase [Acidianus sulfidivorans JP7]
MVLRANRLAYNRIKKRKTDSRNIPSISFDQIYDQKDIKKRLDEIIDEIKNGNTYGIILFGPPGTGKTSLSKAIANKLKWNFFELKASDVLSKWYGESEVLLTSFLDEVEANQPAVLLIDEIDSFTMSRDNDLHEVTHRLINILLNRIQDFHDKRDKILIIGTTNIPQDIDEAFLRPGRFDEVLYVPLPDEDGRKEIWKGYINDDRIDYELLAKKSPRYSPADIKLIVNEVKSSCKERECRTEDYLNALEEYKPSVQISTLIKFENIAKKYSRKKIKSTPYGIPDITWDDLGDLEKVKQTIRDSIELPLKNKEFASRLGIKPVKGILLYGPPGTGKTSVAKALANGLNASFIILSGEEIASAGIKAPEVISEKFNIARDNSPAIIFIDEIDAIAKNRMLNEWRTALTELLSQMDGIRESENIIIIGATNRPWDLDPAILRPGRFDKLIYVPPPDFNGRISILKVLTKGLEIDDETLNRVAENTNNFTPADLKLLIDEVKRNLLKEASQTKVLRTKIDYYDFQKVLTNMKPSVDPNSLKMYENFHI